MGPAGWVLTGAASREAALSDNSDTSYVTGASNDVVLLMGFGTFTLPALAQVRSITSRARIQTPTGTGAVIIETRSANDAIWGTGSKAGTATITTQSFNVSTTGPGGAPNPWSQADIDGIRMALYGNAVYDPSRVMEIYLDVLYNERPVTTVSGPTGAQATSAPIASWIYLDPEGDLQALYHVKVYPSTIYTLPGFDPATSSGATVDFPTGTGAGTSHQLPSLGIGTYRAYVRTSDVGASGAFGVFAAGADFTVATPPAVPLITAVTPETAANRMAVSLTGRDNQLTRTQAGAESGALAWLANTNCTIVYSQTAALEGLASIRMTATAGGDMSMRTWSGAFADGIPVKVGATYAGLASFSRGVATARSVRVKLEWRDSAGTVLGGTVTGASATEPASGFIQASASGVAPTGAVWGVLYAEVLAAGAAELHYVDQMSFAPETLTTWTRGGLVQERGNLADTFTRADSAVSLGTAETVDVVESGAWTANLGTWGIVSNRAYLVTTTASGTATLATSFIMDGVVEADITLSPTALRSVVGLVFRANSSTENLSARLRLLSGVNAVELYQRVGAADTLVAAFNSAGLVASTTYRLRVAFYGPRVRVYLDNVLRIDYTILTADLTFFTSSNDNRAGLFISAGAALDDGGSRIDNFSLHQPKTQVVALERSLDSGLTWALVRGAQAVVLADIGQVGTAYDYEVPRDTVVTYRARVGASEDGFSFFSAYSTPVTGGPLTSDGLSWLKNPSNPALSVSLCLVAETLEVSSSEDQGVFYAEGRQFPIINSGTIRGETMSLELAFANDAAFDAFEVLRRRQEPLLFQTVFGDDGLDQYWLRLGNRRSRPHTTHVAAMAKEQLRTVRVDAIEVASPAVV